MESTSNKTKAMLIHLSALTQYFFPFGNFIFPLIIWSIARNDSRFIDLNGRRALNFQISIMLYVLVLALISIPIFLFTIFRNVTIAEWNNGLNSTHIAPEALTGVVLLAVGLALLILLLKIAEFFLVIYGSVKALDGVAYKYPLSIPFLGGSNQPVEALPTSESSDGVSSSSSNESIS